MTIGVSIVHFVIKVPKLVQMIVTIYRVQAYQVPIFNPRWPQKSKMAATIFSFFDISTSDRGDFPAHHRDRLKSIKIHKKKIMLRLFLKISMVSQSLTYLGSAFHNLGA